MDRPNINDWYLLCCCRDAYQFQTQQEIDGILESNKEYEEDGIEYHFYKTIDDIVKQSCPCEGRCHLYSKTLPYYLAQTLPREIT